jgi:hypothetical protein
MMVAMGQLDSPSAPHRWTFSTRGAFTFGTCVVCGFRTPARRARYSAETDLRAHTLLCEAAEELHADSVGEGLEPTEA